MQKALINVAMVNRSRLTGLKEKEKTHLWFIIPFLQKINCSIFSIVTNINQSLETNWIHRFASSYSFFSHFLPDLQNMIMFLVHAKAHRELYCLITLGYHEYTEVAAIVAFCYFSLILCLNYRKWLFLSVLVRTRLMEISLFSYQHGLQYSMVVAIVALPLYIFI